MATYVKKWNGSSWVEVPVKRWNGSGWVDAYTYKWNGSAWIQIYPEVGITYSGTVKSGYTATYTYRHNTYKNWKKEDAKQGNGLPYGNSSGDADSHNSGYLNFRCTRFTGSGSIDSLSSASFTGTRGGAGSYNNNQTITFYRSGLYVSSSNYSSLSAPDLTGSFTCTTGGPGSGGTMSKRSISGLSNCLNWMNGVSGKERLCIDDSTRDNYLSISGETSMTVSYVYIATAAAYLAADAQALSTYQIKKSDLTDADIYHKMILYPEEVGMTLNEVMAHREENNLNDISMNDVVTDYVPQVNILDSSVDNDKITVKLTHLRDYHIPEYSIDGVIYNPLQSSAPEFYHGLYNDKDFNPYMNNIYIRVRNTATDNIDFSYIEEPKILIA